MTIAELINHYGITIETPRITVRSGLSLQTPYTLRYQGRELSGSILVEKTITCEQALTSLFVMADKGQAVAELYEDARSSERELKHLLGEHYEVFHHAYLADPRHQRRR
jgi:hypothetical protein